MCLFLSHALPKAWPPLLRWTCGSGNSTDSYFHKLCNVGFYFLNCWESSPTCCDMLLYYWGTWGFLKVFSFILHHVMNLSSFCCLICFYLMKHAVANVRFNQSSMWMCNSPILEDHCAAALMSEALPLWN